VGDYRLAYDFARAEGILRILDIAHRSEAYTSGGLDIDD
jgi:mRNA-degrading endonuclease RelE of RelBE toxin-antitoxin system